MENGASADVRPLPPGNIALLGVFPRATSWLPPVLLIRSFVSGLEIHPTRAQNFESLGFLLVPIHILLLRESVSE